MDGAGTRRCLMVIQSPSTVATADGSTINTLTNTATVFASITPLGGRELYLARAQQDLSTHRIRMPYLAGITPQMRGVYAGRVFNFTNINNINELNREMELAAIEVLGESVASTPSTSCTVSAGGTNPFPSCMGTYERLTSINGQSAYRISVSGGNPPPFTWYLYLDAATGLWTIADNLDSLAAQYIWTGSEANGSYEASFGSSGLAVVAGVVVV